MITRACDVCGDNTLVEAGKEGEVILCNECVNPDQMVVLLSDLAEVRARAERAEATLGHVRYMILLLRVRLGDDREDIDTDFAKIQKLILANERSTSAPDTPDPKDLTTEVHALRHLLQQIDKAHEVEDSYYTPDDVLVRRWHEADAVIDTDVAQKLIWPETS